MHKHSRKYLNPKYGFASIEWTVNVREGGSVNGRKYKYVDTELSISDCTRTINLDFDVASAREARAAIKKIDLLIDELQKFRSAMIEAGIEKETIPLHTYVK